MSKTINNKEYRLKLFKEKIYKSTLKVQNNINNKNSNKYLKCPHCKGEEVIKYGSYNGISVKIVNVKEHLQNKLEVLLDIQKSLKKIAINIRSYMKED